MGKGKGSRVEPKRHRSGGVHSDLVMYTQIWWCTLRSSDVHSDLVMYICSSPSSFPSVFNVYCRSKGVFWPCLQATDGPGTTHLKFQSSNKFVTFPTVFCHEWHWGKVTNSADGTWGPEEKWAVASEFIDSKVLCSIQFSLKRNRCRKVYKKNLAPFPMFIRHWT